MLSPFNIASPQSKPLTLDEVKSHLRVDHNDDDALITIYLDAAVSHLDGLSGTLGRALITQEWEQSYSGFCDKMRLPLGDIMDVTSIYYYNTDNVSTLLAASVYDIKVDSLGAYVQTKPGQSWPATYTRDNAVTIDWTCGFGSASSVPAAIKAAMLLMIGHWYRNREAVVFDGSPVELPMAVNALLDPWRRNRV